VEADLKVPGSFKVERSYMKPYAVGDGGEEIYVVAYGQDMIWDHEASFNHNLNLCRIAIRSSGPLKPKGKIYIPKPDLTGMVCLGFVANFVVKNPLEAKQSFLNAKENYYLDLLRLEGPGGAWYRHQVLSISNETVDETERTMRERRTRRWSNDTDLNRTFDFYTGGRAISENMQLDRELRALEDLSNLDTPIDSLSGITIAEIDWKPLIEGKTPERDALAHAIPHDQHVLFFPSFQAMVDMVDETRARGTPVLHLVETRTEDAGTLGRYENQLCLPLDGFSRIIGPKLIQGVAMTGSDPYLRTGSDLAVLFDTRDVDALKRALLIRQGLAMMTESSAKTVSGRLANGMIYTGLVSDGRRICSYLAVLDKMVVVSNSVHQLNRLALTFKGDGLSINDLDEYTFFRSRYKKGAPEETAFLIVSDATIRRLCGPKWKIGASRRTRAAALMMQLQAEHLGELQSGSVVRSEIKLDAPIPLLEGFFINEGGVSSATFGNLDFLTPIAELEIDMVSKIEKDAYIRFSQAYSRQWSTLFDPIAARFNVKEGKIGLDLTVMPLTVFSDYRELIDFAGDAVIESGARGMHKEAIFHFVMSLDRDSKEVKEINNFAMSVSKSVNPLTWIGDWIAIYADEDPFWQGLEEAADKEGDKGIGRYMEQKLPSIPIAIQLDISSQFKLATFLTAFRAYVDQSSPGMLQWEAKKHNGLNYVKVSSTEESTKSFWGNSDWEELALYYAPMPDSLVVTLSESVLKRALERRKAKTKARAECKDTQPVKALAKLGDSIEVRAVQSTVLMLEGMFSEDIKTKMQHRCFANIMALNEWRRQFKTDDPGAFHKKHWRATLLCPGGGDFIWNEKFQTMESTVFGHPGEAKKPKGVTSLFSFIKQADFGLTFENDGLRAKVEIELEK